MSRYIFVVTILFLAYTGCGYLGGRSVDSIQNAELLNNRQVFENSNRNNSVIAPLCSDPLWSDDLGGVRLTWTMNDIFLSNNEQKVGVFLPSFTKLHEDSVKNVRSTLTSDSEFLRTKKKLELKSAAVVVLKSVVEGLVTFEIEYGSILEGSPASHKVWWLTVDMSKRGNIDPFSVDDIENINSPKSTSLTDVFAESELRKALFDTLLVQQALAKRGLAIEPGSLQFLFGKKESSHQSARLEIGSEGNFLTPYSLDHFVFERIENNKVIVRLALVEFALTANYKVEFLEMALPIPTEYAEIFRMADEQKLGFLGVDSEKISAGCGTSIELTTGIALQVNH